MASNDHREIFGMVIRLFGFFAIILGLYRVCHVIALVIGLPTMSIMNGSQAAALALFYLVIGLFSLGEANWIVRFAYGSSSEKAN